MAYESVDALQRALTENVFYYAKDAKKAAGRALGTLVEIITFYLLKGWDYERYTAIERRVAEYGNPDITHNVEFTLHPSFRIATVLLGRSGSPITSRKIIAKLPNEVKVPETGIKGNVLLSSNGILRNACTLWESAESFGVGYLEKYDANSATVGVYRLLDHPFAVLECKRVGVEEGMKKGPQTIEKAKQGAYVARAISSLQKVRLRNGAVHGILHTETGEMLCKPYVAFLEEIIVSNAPEILKDFTLTVGVVSNHGNWFTSEDHNKELKVLAQSYDWLLFLTDAGLSEFVETLLIKPKREYESIRDAFAQSYNGRRGVNRFTKVRIDLRADQALQDFFRRNSCAVERWFNTISPKGRGILELKDELLTLASKRWDEIFA